MVVQLRELFENRIGKSDINDICAMRKTLPDNQMEEALWQLLFDSDDKVAERSAWVLAHLQKGSMQWFYQHKESLIDEAMATSSISKCRIILSMLTHFSFAVETLRTDFLDWCLMQLSDSQQTIGIRSCCMKLAYVQSCYIPELCSELREVLNLLVLPGEQLPKALSCCRYKLLKILNKPNCFGSVTGIQ